MSDVFVSYKVEDRRRVRPLVEALEPARRLCHWRLMHTQNPRAGGFFLMAAILLGFVVGLATNDAMRGVVIGTAIGIAIAIALWIVDRRNR